jgi:hypothetical protein
MSADDGKREKLTNDLVKHFEPFEQVLMENLGEIHFSRVKHDARAFVFLR